MDETMRSHKLFTSASVVKQTLLPTIWIHIVWGFCRNFVIALFGIVSLLLSTRIEDIARFVALGASLQKILLFSLYQVPYVLQVGIPIASLVAGFALASNMSSNGEIMAARTSGYSFSMLIFPTALAGSFLGIFLMFGVFDVAARCHLAAKKLEFDVREEAPLAALQSSQLLSKHGIALELTGSLSGGQEAKDLLACLTLPGKNRLSLIVIKHTQTDKEELHGQKVTMITTKAPPTQNEKFGTLLIENAKHNNTPISHVHEVTQRHNWKVVADHLPLSVLRARTEEVKQEMLIHQYKGHSAKKLVKQLGKYTSEPFRRISLSLAAFSLCLAGTACGIRTSREAKKFLHIIGPVVAFGIFILCYLAGKSFDEIAAAAIFLYLLPHPLLIAASMSLVRRLEHGMEY